MIEDVEVPEGWSVYSLGNLAYFINGYAFKPEDWKEEGLPIVRIEQLKDPNAKCDYSDKKLPDIHLIDNGDIIFSWSATLAIKLWDRGRAYLNQHLYKVIPRPTIEKVFLKYLLEHKIEELSKETHGSTMKHITRPFLLNFKVEYPKTLPEQRKIAEILETVDNAIERTDTIIEKYKRIKQGLMQDLLTRGVVGSYELGVMSYELRDEKKHRFKDSTLGRIPEEWEVVELGEVGKIISGSTPDTSNKEFWDGDIVWITPDDLSKSKKYIDNSSRKITLKGLRSCSAKLIKEDSIIISSRAPIGYLEINKVQIATNQGCKSIELNNNIFVEFFYYNLHRYIQKMINLGSGTTFTEISKSQLKKMMISLPKSIKEQHRIASILSQMDQTIEKEQKYKQKLESIKQGLMDDLLTGKVRVNHLIKEGMENVQPA